MATQNFYFAVYHSFKEWQNDRIDIVHFFRGVLIHLGFWPVELQDGLQKVSRLNTTIARCTFWMGFIIVGCICPTTLYTSAGNDFGNQILALGTLFVSTLIILVIGSLMYRVENYEDAIKALGVMVENGSHLSLQSKAIADDNKKLEGKLIHFYGIYVVALLPSLLVMLAVSCAYSREFIFRSWYPYDYHQSPAFEITLALWVTFTIVGLHVLVAVSLMIWSFIMQAVKHLRILNHNLRQIVEATQEAMGMSESSPLLPEATSILGDEGPTNNLDVSPAENCPESRDRNFHCSSRIMESLSSQGHLKSKFDWLLEANLKNCVVLHQSIISFLETVIKAVDLLLLQFLGCAIFPTLTALMFIIYATEFKWVMVFLMLLFITCEISLAMLCWVADNVAEESSNVREAIYSCDWFGQSESFKRSMRIMMSQSNQPLVVKVFSWIPITLETFFGVMKLMFTYYESLEAAMLRDTR